VARTLGRRLLLYNFAFPGILTLEYFFMLSTGNQPRQIAARLGFRYCRLTEPD
jgi:hypothetical protein